MDKLIEELTYFAYDGERDFFDITRSEAKSFLNELGKKDDEIERLNKENEELKKIQCTFLGTGCKAEMERLNNIIDELEKYINNEWNAIEKEPDNSFFDGYDTCIEEMKKDILDKIKELKGSNNYE